MHEEVVPLPVPGAPRFDIKEFVSEERPKLTLAQTDREALASWLMQYQDNKNTLESFKREGLRFILWIEYQRLSLSAISVEHISAYWAFLANPQPWSHWCSSPAAKYDTAGKRVPGWRAPRPPAMDTPEWRPFVSNLGPNAIRHAQSVIFLWFEYLANVGYLPGNILRSVRRRRARIKAGVVDRHLPTEAFKAVLAYIDRMQANTHSEHMQQARARFVFMFLCLTGLRRFELANATTEDIVTDSQGWWLKVTGKGDKDAEIPLPDDAVTAFKIYREKLGRPPLPAEAEPLVMDSYGKGKPMSPESIYLIIKTLMRNAADEAEGTNPRVATALRKVSPHWLRHTSATQQLQAGIPLTVVQSNMRHSDISTTRRYLHDERNDRHRATKGFKLPN